METRAALDAIHRRLLSGSPTASLELFKAALGPLTRYVRRHFPTLEEEQAHDIATDAILAHVADPARCDLARGSLQAFLWNMAHRDAQDLIRKRRRRQELLDNATNDVEFWAARAKTYLEQDDRLDASRIMATFGRRIVTNDAEAAVLALILNEERSTTPFAVALGLDGKDPQAEAVVKRAKDKLLLRLKRLRDAL